MKQFLRDAWDLGALVLDMGFWIGVFVMLAGLVGMLIGGTP
jgi:hypothetical protein